MQKPNIKNKTVTENTVELLVSFDKNAEYFDGHFDELTVLPGVVQLHYIMLLAEEYFAVTPEISAITKLKFSNIIKPERDVSLKMEYMRESGKITFQYFSADKVYSSGVVNLK